MGGTSPANTESTSAPVNIGGGGTLTFTGGTFTNVGSTISLGMLKLTAPNPYVASGSQGFNLKTSFLQPMGIVPGSDTSAACINGSLFFNNGTYSLDFRDNTPTHYTYNGGAFDFTVNDPGKLSGAGTFAITGTISNASITTTPEPGSMALLGTGLVGLVPMIRRRRK